MPLYIRIYIYIYVYIYIHTYIDIDIHIYCTNVGFYPAKAGPRRLCENRQLIQRIDFAEGPEFCTAGETEALMVFERGVTQERSSRRDTLCNKPVAGGPRARN